MLVELIARGDRRLRKSAGIEQLARFVREVSEIAGVESNSNQVVTTRTQALTDLDRIPNALQRVVRVHQQQTVVRHYLGVLLEGFELAVEGHHPAVRMCSLDGDVVRRAGENVRGGDAAADVRGPARVETAVHALRAPQAE